MRASVCICAHMCSHSMCPLNVSCPVRVETILFLLYSALPTAFSFIFAFRKRACFFLFFFLKLLLCFCIFVFYGCHFFPSCAILCCLLLFFSPVHLPLFSYFVPAFIVSRHFISLPPFLYIYRIFLLFCCDCQWPTRITCSLCLYFQDAFVVLQ